MANDYWKDFKKLFKSKQRIQEEESQAIGEAVEKEKDILAKLKLLEKEYQSGIEEETPDFDSLFKPVTLDRVAYDVDSDEKINQTAEKEAEVKFAPKVTTINAKTLENLAMAEAKKNEVAENTAHTLKEISELYEALREKTMQDGIKKGVSRSSIVDNSLQNYENMRVSDESEAKKNYMTELKVLDKQIADLEADRLTALEDLNLQKAVNISDTIATLTAKREKTLAEETTKNNAIKKQEAELNAKLQKEKEKYISNYYAEKEKQAEKQIEDEKVNGYTGEKQYNFAERYNIALQFYLSLDPEIAPKALEASGNMKYYLGNYYDKLMTVLNERNSQGRKYI